MPQILACVLCICYLLISTLRDMHHLHCREEKPEKQSTCLELHQRLESGRLARALTWSLGLPFLCLSEKYQHVSSGECEWGAGALLPLFPQQWP